jgi:F-type H+-transporting ATPase subunit b
MSVIAVLLAAEEHKPNGFFISDWNEWAWNTVAFILIVALIVKLAGPAAKKAFKARTERIEHELAAAEASRAEAQAAGERVNASVRNADVEASRIVADARDSAEAMREQLRQRADEEVADLRARAQADIEASKTQAIADLRAEVSQLALGAAESVVRRNLDATTQAALVENYINQVGINQVGAR